MRNKEHYTNKYVCLIFYACSFFLPVMLYMVVYARGHFWPFGDRSVLVCDLLDQLFPFITSIRYTHTGGNSFFFNWSCSLGGNYFGLHGYYLNSPLNFFTRFVPVEKMPQAIAVLTVIKTGLMGLTFSISQVHMVKKYLKVVGCRIFAFLPLTIAYTFTVYNFKYAMHLMWFDSLILLPLVILGVEEIFEGKKGLLYLVSLTGAFYFNYYIGYMIGIFSALYFIARMITEFSLKDIKVLLKKGIRYFLVSVSSIGLVAPLLTGILTDLSRGKIDGEELIVHNPLMFENIGEMFKKLRAIDLELPTARSGWFEAVLVLAFLLLPNIKLREKISYALLHAFMILSFYNTRLYLMWHCFRYPNDFLYRFQFLYNFLFVLTALRALCGVFEIIGRKKSAEEFFTKKKFLYAFLVISSVILFAECVELGKRSLAVMGNLDIKYRYKMISDYEEFIGTTKPLTDRIMGSDKDLYRVNLDYLMTRNDSMILGYNGINFFSSTYNRNINSFLSNIGFSQYSVWNAGYGTNPSVDGLLSVRYSLSPYEPGDYYSKTIENNGVSVYVNDHTAGVIYAAPVDTLSPEIVDWDVYQNLNRIMDDLDGSEVDENYYTELAYELTTNGNRMDITFDTVSNQPVYMQMVNFANPESSLYINGEEYVKYFTTDTQHNIYVGTYEPNERVEISVVSDNGETVYPPIVHIAQLDTGAVSALMDRLRDSSLHIDSYEDGKISGRIYVPEGCRIITSIPAEDGWTVKVDDNVISTDVFADTFIAMDVSPGEHYITMKYYSPGIKNYTWIMVVSFIFILFYLQFENIVSKCKDRHIKIA